ncbi:hypothetical protein QLQ12_37480 [Actinoplanes sp. NEAU-A12]|uniref:Uncharacterized protein n=1 Tax=Actinoplanes sandaracinus TaxID=3045177 RepID=A0ABT6WXG8_9ACTN|nr:hypothetical protein [Actinoplanes sandaracinus]MDI6104300.1 hypothetical protein [Actinoplanes sandaracinus]
MAVDPADSGLLFTTDRYGNEVVAPSEVTCGMNSIMQHVEDWAHAEGSAVLGKLPQFDRHDQHAIEGAQQALLAIGSTLGLKSAANSDGGFTLASNTDLIQKVAKLVGEDGQNAGWYQDWTGWAADYLKGGFFASIAPTFLHQAGIVAWIHNLYSARGSVIQEMRAGSLKILSDAGKALDATKKVTTDLNPVWQTCQGMGTALSIAGGWNPVVGAVGAECPAHRHPRAELRTEDEEHRVRPRRRGGDDRSLGPSRRAGR